MRGVMSKMPERKALAIKSLLAAGWAELLRDGFVAGGTRGSFLLTYRCGASLNCGGHAGPPIYSKSGQSITQV